MARGAAVVGLVVVLLAGCGEDDPAVTAGSDPDQVRYRGTVSVLESPEHGPELCVAMADSLPPQCGGPAVIGWDWAAVEGEESASGTTWGSFEVTGTWDGEALTLTEPAGPAVPGRGPDTDFTSPCPEPAGGWAPVDPATTTVEAQDEAGAVARALPTFAGLWVDQSINPALADGMDPGDEEVANDPELLVLNVRVTDDVAGAEEAIRKVWGGALCVSEAERTQAELLAIQSELGDELADTGLLGGIGVDEMTGRVRVDALLAPQALLDDLADRYGDAVQVDAVLEPID